MALVNKSKLQWYLAEAKSRKSDIRTVYNRVLDLTDTFAKINDNGKPILESQREVDSAVTDSIDALKSFIMNSIFPRQGNWADLYIDEDRLIAEEGDGIKSTLAEINKTKENDINKVFKYIQSSNYYKEISKAVESFIKVGTGCYCIRETGSTSRPFMYGYVGLDNLYILEDAHSDPNIVFKLHPEVNAEYILDLFGRGVVLPESIIEDDLSSNVDVYEVVIPEYDEETTITKYNYMIVLSDMETVLKEMSLNYNPFVVFRWDVTEGTPWGKSIVVNNIGLLEELEQYKEIYKSQARRIANPAAMFVGNEELFYGLDLSEGKLNYGGDSFKDGQQGIIEYLSTGSSLMPLDSLIASARSAFRQSLMVDNMIMNIEQGKGTTATFVQTMQEMFRKRFANTYELINSELLQPTFMAPFNIMLKYNMLTLQDGIIPYASLIYINSLSKASNLGDVTGLMNYVSTISGINQAQQAGVILDTSKANIWIAEKMDIDKDLIPTEEELNMIQQMRLEQQEEANEQQQNRES